MFGDRLLKLAELLEADAVNPHGIKFDLSQWGSTSDADDTTVSVSCGTHACAMGLAVVSGAFAEHGLFNASGAPWRIIPGMVTSGSREFRAAAELFDIQREEAEWLFLDDSYGDEVLIGSEGELIVASRIREFVAENAK